MNAGKRGICRLQSDIGYGIVGDIGVTVLQGGSLPNLKEKGGGVNEYIRGVDITGTFRNVPRRAACLHRQ